MAAIRHLGIVVCSYKTTHEASVIGCISLSNFKNPMHSFEDMEIWIFCRFGLKCLFTPQNFGFWGKIWENLLLGEKWPPRKLIATKTHLLVHWASSQRPQGPLWPYSRNKKKKKSTRGDNFTHTPPHPTFWAVTNFCMQGRVPDIINDAKF